MRTASSAVRAPDVFGKRRMEAGIWLNTLSLALPRSTRRRATVMTSAPDAAATAGMRLSEPYLPVPMKRRLPSSTPPIVRVSVFVFMMCPRHSEKRSRGLKPRSGFHTRRGVPSPFPGRSAETFRPPTPPSPRNAGLCAAPSVRGARLPAGRGNFAEGSLARQRRHPGYPAFLRTEQDSLRVSRRGATSFLRA